MLDFLATRRLRLVLAALLLPALLGVAAPAAAQTSEPQYPSPEWFQREALNFATVTQAPAEQATDPDFQLRWNQQSAANREHYMRRRYIENTWWWDSTGNLCNHWSGPCTGDPYLYPGVDPFYENEGLVEEAIYFDAQGALLSGRVWVPKSSQPGDNLPGVVIETGSVQAPETLYWWFAQTLVRNGYAVMTYEVRGQGRSDNHAANGEPGSNSNSSVFATNLVDTIEFFLSTPDNPYPRTGTRAGAPIDDFNPFHDRIDRDRVGIVGHSLGATGASVVQGMDPWPGRLLSSNPVDVAVAWDNLSASGSLAGHTVTPRVPTMGQSADYGLVPVPHTSPPNPQGKNSGFNAWKQAGVSSYQINVRGGTHYEWSLLPGFPTSSWEWGNPLADHYSLAWLDRWLKLPGEAGYDDADARLLNDAAWVDRMSFYFDSARFFPTRTGAWQDCADIKAGCEPTVAEPRATSLSLVVEGNGARRQLIATLVDSESGAGVEGKEISFFADGTAIGTATTDADGNATLKPPRPYRTGHRTYRAEFPGDENYGASSGEANS
ncbi:MAG: alpha/beta hydrolase family protein [Actinomycetota bacterium]